ncbi:PH domain-containing protein [Desulfovibrio ferrophilus]|uniref:Bacterial Pleckstrin homology domain-containing protein n=1 Tax=Desulfovibrio ferrophilus TaxID=241368 RepID=A0A2Z6B3S6_9BACT|nr:PH domain-containing protein [Desulfovibrio ferrophilus]BBD10098.1 uncharacterized protein DFE_3372 [Desulfovibrio ferrophilus]
MAAIFPVPICRKVPLSFLLFIAMVTTATVWSVRSGFLWTGICLVAVTAPLAALYWWMLHVNPSKTRIIIDDGDLLVDAPPFLKANQPMTSISRAFVANMNDEDEFRDMKKEQCMAFFGYKNGIFKTASNKDAIVVARSNKVLCLETPERWFLLGPKDLDGLIQAVGQVIPVKNA